MQKYSSCFSKKNGIYDTYIIKICQYIKPSSMTKFVVESWNTADNATLHISHFQGFYDSFDPKIGLFQEVPSAIGFQVVQLYPDNSTFVAKTSFKRTHETCCEMKNARNCVDYEVERVVDTKGMLTIWSKHFDTAFDIITPKYLSNAYKNCEFGRRTSNWHKLLLGTQTLYVVNVHLQVPKVSDKGTRMHPKSVAIMKRLKEDMDHISAIDRFAVMNDDSLFIFGGDFNVLPANLRDLGMRVLPYFTDEYTNICPIKGRMRLDYIFAIGKSEYEYIEEYVLPMEHNYDHRQVRIVVE